MYISANVDDCALIINDFLSQDLFKKINKYQYKTNLTSHKDWQKTLFKDKNNDVTMNQVFSKIDLATVEYKKIKSIDLIFEKFLKILIDCPFIPYQINSKISLHYYEYNKYSGINWHDDGPFTLNYSFYIHDEWDENWGGETLIDTNRGMPLCSTPIPNSLLAIKNGIRHKVNCVIGPKKRKVLQVRGVFFEDNK